MVLHEKDLFFTGERVGFKVLVGLRHYGAMQTIDHAVNYNRDAALGMTHCLQKGIPSLLGMPGGQASHW